MSESSPIKDALYAKINNVGQEEVHKLLLKEEFSKIFEKFYEPIIHEIQSIEEYEKYGTLAESMTHYLFTEMLIPSQRKIIFENIELDIVIPNTLELQKNSNNAIIIFFVKTSDLDQIKQRIQEIKKIQKNDANIWVITKDEIEISQSTYYATKESFSEFLKDSKNFINAKKMNKLNIFKT